MTTFTARYTRRTGTILLEGRPEKVFPLFEPVGEKHWAAGWEPHFVYPASEVAQEGAVFMTRYPDAGTATWTITRYEPEEFRVEYVRVVPGWHVGKVAVKCESEEGGRTKAQVTYSYTALSEEGNAFIERFTAEHYGEMMASWEKAINDYLRNGATLLHH